MKLPLLPSGGFTFFFLLSLCESLILKWNKNSWRSQKMTAFSCCVRLSLHLTLTFLSYCTLSKHNCYIFRFVFQVKIAHWILPPYLERCRSLSLFSPLVWSKAEGRKFSTGISAGLCVIDISARGGNIEFSILLFSFLKGHEVCAGLFLNYLYNCILTSYNFLQCKHSYYLFL